jgi:hypothetical protein
MATVSWCSHLDGKLLTVFLFQIKENISKIPCGEIHGIDLWHTLRMRSEGALLEVPDDTAIIPPWQESIGQQAVLSDTHEGRKRIKITMVRIDELHEGIA